MFRVKTPTWFEERIQAGVDSWTNPSWGKLFILAPWAVGLICLIYGSIAKHQVAVRQKTVLGEITANHQNHDQCAYRFVVDGAPYQGSSNSPSEPTVGRVVTVYYDPKDPTTNSLTDFSQLSQDLLGPVPFLAIACATGVLIVFRLRRTAAKRASLS